MLPVLKQTPRKVSHVLTVNDIIITLLPHISSQVLGVFRQQFPMIALKRKNNDRLHPIDKRLGKEEITPEMRMLDFTMSFHSGLSRFSV